jgi:hypothetical protein
MAQEIAYVGVLAGGPKKDLADYPYHTAFGGKPCLEYAIDAALNEGLFVVTSVRESGRLAQMYHTDPRVFVLDAREKLFDSLIEGLLEYTTSLEGVASFTGNPRKKRDVKRYLNTHPQLRDMAVLYIGSDSPYIQSSDIDNAVKEYKEADFPGFASKVTLAPKVINLPQKWF